VFAGSFHGAAKDRCAAKGNCMKFGGQRRDTNNKGRKKTLNRCKGEKRKYSSRGRPRNTRLIRVDAKKGQDTPKKMGLSRLLEKDGSRPKTKWGPKRKILSPLAIKIGLRDNEGWGCGRSLVRWSVNQTRTRGGVRGAMPSSIKDPLGKRTQKGEQIIKQAYATRS